MKPGDCKLSFILQEDFSGWTARIEDWGGDGKVWGESNCEEDPLLATQFALTHFLSNDACPYVLLELSLVDIGMCVERARAGRSLSADTAENLGIVTRQELRLLHEKVPA